jgi:hypothetical protein
LLPFGIVEFHPFSIVMVMNDKMMDASREDVGEEVC